MTPYNVGHNAYVGYNELSCEVPLERFILRNSAHGFASESWTYSVDDQYASRDASELAGNAVEIHSNNRSYLQTFPGSIVRGGDYIYFQNSNALNYSQKRLEIIEYQISTGTKSYITVVTYPSTFTTFCRMMHIAYIADRKVLVYEKHGAITDYENIYLVDFEAGTSSVELTIYMPTSFGAGPTDIHQLYTMKDANGDIRLLVGGGYYNRVGDGDGHLSDGVYWYQKNYTQGGDWSAIVHAECAVPSAGDEECYRYQHPLFIGRDKLVIFGSNFPYNGNTNKSGVIAFVYDINNHIISTSQLRGTSQEEILVYFSGVDHNTGLVYLNAYDYLSEEASGYVLSFNPTTGDFEYIYTLEDPDGYTFIPIFVSKDGTCYYDIAAGKLYDSDTKTLLATNPFNTEYWTENVGMIMDDNGPSILYWNKSTSKLQRLALDGTVIVEYSLSSSITAAAVQIIHLDDVIVMTSNNGLMPNTIKYWLVT